ncbi:uncharacterized protein PRCAT00004367001 [Priceomyces carsonii]|uniref:uncharacterized protein n=1 Tax=Priceomyces carsonii TaxID=28549 RepID=UPI002EDB1BEE|nr:unnamed protein product [Priceomyces carsonii]
MSMSSDYETMIEEENRAEDDIGLRGGELNENNRSNLRDISLLQRMLSACLGSVVTSLVVTPFDVIRIRIQQQEMLPKDSVCCQFTVPEGGKNTLAKSSAKVLQTAGTTNSSELFWLGKNYCKNAENCTRVTSTFQGFATVSKNEGLATLWRGLSINLLMAVPSNIIYFTGYDHIRDHSPLSDHPLNPLFCGSLARILAATFVSPLELIKTRLQSIPAGVGTNSNVMKVLLKDVFLSAREKGIGTLFTGLQITLWRDAPFSGIYWSCYELLKDKVSKTIGVDFGGVKNSVGHDWKVFSVSFISGSISGSIAAFFTHPFDVGKTRLQITNQQLSKGKKERSMFSFLFSIYKREGIGALYSGFGPRVLKVAPSCAIMISSYELSKKLFKNGNNFS